MEPNTSGTPADPDVAIIRRIASVPPILRLLRLMTGTELVAVARVAERRWTACAVLDESGVGIEPGGQLDADATICGEVRRQAAPIAIDDASRDPVYGRHEFFRRFPFRSYIGEPILLGNGSPWGVLCAMGLQPTQVSDEKTLALFRHFADQIASEIDAQARSEAMDQALDDERSGGVLRERFIAVLGHDLRNPLSSISAAANVQKLRSGDPAVTAMSDRILTSVRRMAAMIDDLFDLARGRLGGGVRVALGVVDDLAVALEDVVDELRGSNPERPLRSRIEVDRPVRGDKGRLQQLVSNLIGNAVSHGAAGTPIVVEASTAAGRLEIRVRNEGRAIPPDTIAGIFDAFNRRESAVPGPRDGLGLGLYICQQIVLAHHGELAVTSTSEETVFTATIPID